MGQNLFASSGRYVSLCKLYNSTRLARKKGITLAPLVSSTSSTLWEITFLRGLREVSREKYTASRRISSDRHFLTTSSVLERKKDENRLWIDVNGGTYELFFFFKQWKLALFNWEGNFQEREIEEIECIHFIWSGIGWMMEKWIVFFGGKELPILYWNWERNFDEREDKGKGIKKGNENYISLNIGNFGNVK